MRLTNEWDALWKGATTAHQFEAVFEEATTELELAGLAKNQRELLLGYLQKVGPQPAAEIFFFCCATACGAWHTKVPPSMACRPLKKQEKKKQQEGLD